MYIAIVIAIGPPSAIVVNDRSRPDANRLTMLAIEDA
jgi:hypothetical protein